jgi:hypothetical protein
MLVSALTAAAARAQQPPLPEGTVARVGDEAIPKSEFDTWFTGLASRTPWLLSDPPDYERCISTLADRAERKGRALRRRALRRRCRERAEATHDSAMGFTLEAVWMRQEAARVGIVLTLPEIARRVTRYRRSLNSDDRRALAHLTDAQFASIVALSMLFERLVDRVLATIPEVTPAQVRRYYAHHPRRYRHVSRKHALERIEARLDLVRHYRATLRFIVRLFDRYTKLTQCAQGYIVEACANSESDGSDEGGGIIIEPG